MIESLVVGEHFIRHFLDVTNGPQKEGEREREREKGGFPLLEKTLCSKRKQECWMNDFIKVFVSLLLYDIDH